MGAWPPLRPLLEGRGEGDRGYGAGGSTPVRSNSTVDRALGTPEWPRRRPEAAPRCRCPSHVQSAFANCSAKGGVFGTSARTPRRIWPKELVDDSEMAASPSPALESRISAPSMGAPEARAWTCNVPLACPRFSSVSAPTDSIPPTATRLQALVSISGMAQILKLDNTQPKEAHDDDPYGR